MLTEGSFCCRNQKRLDTTTEEEEEEGKRKKKKRKQKIKIRTTTTQNIKRGGRLQASRILGSKVCGGEIQVSFFFCFVVAREGNIQKKTYTIPFVFVIFFWGAKCDFFICPFNCDHTRKKKTTTTTKTDQFLLFKKDQPIFPLFFF